MDAAEREALAVSLVEAYQTGTFIPAPSRHDPSFSKPDALAVARRARELRIQTGSTPAGYKVGFTNAAVRAQFDAAAPLAAPIYRETLRAADAIVAGRLLGPRIEPEVVVGVAADGTIAWTALGFEIVQSHVAGWEFGYLDAIVDFGLHAGLVIGERRPWTTGDAQRLAAMHVELRCNDVVVAHGRSSDVDGGVAGSLDWLRADLLRDGAHLAADDIVSTGSMTRVPPIAAGERWTIVASGNELPALSISVR